MRSRGSRHGRQLRNYVLANLGRKPYGSFADVVAETCDFLREEWPDELSKLRWQILDAPTSVVDGKVPRWRADPQEMRITIYRIPIQRQTHTRRTVSHRTVCLLRGWRAARQRPLGANARSVQGLANQDLQFAAKVFVVEHRHD
jgi:hypothetical protein